MTRGAHPDVLAAFAKRQTELKCDLTARNQQPGNDDCWNLESTLRRHAGHYLSPVDETLEPCTRRTVIPPYGYRPNFVRAAFSTGRATLRTFTTIGLAPHVGQVVTFLFRS